MAIAKTEALSPFSGPITVAAPVKKLASPGKANAASATGKVVSSASAQPANAKRAAISAAVLSRKGNPEKRASHNAIERARRESLNSRFLMLAASLPAISEIRRPSKSLIVNRSLQFVADSLNRELGYRQTIRDMHARNRSLLQQLNDLRATLGQHELIEQLPSIEPSLPRSLTEVEKDKPSSRPKNGISTGSATCSSNPSSDLARAAAAAAQAAAAAISGSAGLEDDDYDLDGEDAFPLPAGGMDDMGFGEVASPASMINDGSSALAQLQHEQLAHQAASFMFHGAASHGLQSSGLLSAPQLTPSLSVGTPSVSSPPEFSSNSTTSVASPASMSSSLSAPSAAPHMYELAQSHSVLSAAALAAANAHVHTVNPLPHSRAASLPSMPAGSTNAVAAAMYAPLTPGLPQSGAFDVAAYIQTQQHALAAAHLAAVQAMASQQQQQTQSPIVAGQHGGFAHQQYQYLASMGQARPSPFLAATSQAPGAASIFAGL